MEKGIKVFSAWSANGVPVAEYTVAQIILAGKNFFSLCPRQSCGKLADAAPIKQRIIGNYDATVGLLGAGMIGKKVIEMLRPYRLHILVFDPFLSEEQAAALGVEKVDLASLFRRCRVVSNHLANNDKTKGMLGYSLFASMPQDAVFLNTGRGAQVVEQELCAVLRERPDMTAVLDVTDPEPPKQDSPFYELPNCLLTPHIAGSLGQEVTRMAEYMLNAWKDEVAGVHSPCEVTLAMLATMA